MKYIVRIFVAAASLAPLAETRAQSADSVTLPNIVVSATKAPSEKSRLAVPVTVISGAELQKKGITRVVDALRETPGVSVVQNGSVGSVSSIFLRGGESRYTKVLIDGVPLNAPGGYIDLSHLTTDNVDRIEVVRGPSSVVYGADAVVGVIQIFTKRGGGRSRSSLAARGGSLGARELEISTAGQALNSTYSLAGGFHATDGIFDFNNQYRNGTLSGSAQLPVSGFADFDASARYTTAEYHYPTDYTGAPVDSNSYRVQHRLITSLQAHRDLTPTLRAVLSGGGNDLWDLTEDIRVPYGSTSRVNNASRSAVVRRFGDARLTAQLPGAATVTLGSAYQHEREAAANLTRPPGGVRTETNSFSAARSTSAFYGEILGGVAQHISYSASARLDHSSDFGNFATQSAGLAVNASARTRVRTSYGTAFNAPSFSQLRPTLYTTGNPGLDPERSVSWQLGVEQTVVPGITVSGTLFRQQFRQMIQYVPGGPPTYAGSYANLTAASANGSEIEASIDPSAWSDKLRGTILRANYSEVRPRVTSVDASYRGSLRAGDALIRRPTHSANLSLSFFRRQWDWSAVVSRVGRRPDLDFSQYPSPTVTLPAYARVDAAAAYRLPFSQYGRWEATGRGENLFAARYQEVLGFKAPGRTVLLGFRWAAGGKKDR